LKLLSYPGPKTRACRDLKTRRLLVSVTSASALDFAAQQKTRQQRLWRI
jgi:hypothetical protein